MSPEQSGSSDDRVDRPRSAFSFGGGEGAAYSGPDAFQGGAGAKRSAPGRQTPGGGRRGGRRRAPLLAGVLALLVCAGAAIVVFGGGSGASSGSGGGGVSSTGSAPVSLARAAYVTSRAPGFEYAMSIGGTLDEQSFSVDGEGAINERTLEGTLSMDVHGQKLSELIKNPYVYVSVPAGAGSSVTGGKPWIRANLAGYTQALGDPNPFEANQGRPAQMLTMLDASGNVTTLGTEDVRGVASTHYHALVDLARYAADAPSAQRAALRGSAQELEQITGSSSLPVDVWVDAQGRVRRFSMAIQACTSHGTLHETVSMDFYDFGPQPVVQAPAESEVTDLSSTLDGQAAQVRAQLGCSR
ncbi:MAG TPA: hypothetical protein VK765_03165 [Solirubrobacteraceae bacterium]|jgi:hypothetical protein|nr:hypothetical protein [Solirubrobacteraceae bacterium]